MEMDDIVLKLILLSMEADMQKVKEAVMERETDVLIIIQDHLDDKTLEPNGGIMSSILI
jgi:hypothetical protein